MSGNVLYSNLVETKFLSFTWNLIFDKETLPICLSLNSWNILTGKSKNFVVLNKFINFKYYSLSWSFFSNGAIVSLMHIKYRTNHIHIFVLYTLTISFEIDCFYGLWTWIYEYRSPPPNYRACYGPGHWELKVHCKNVFKTKCVLPFFALLSSQISKDKMCVALDKCLAFLTWTYIYA